MPGTADGAGQEFLLRPRISGVLTPTPNIPTGPDRSSYSDPEYQTPNISEGQCMGGVIREIESVLDAQRPVGGVLESNSYSEPGISKAAC